MTHTLLKNLETIHLFDTTFYRHINFLFVFIRADDLIERISLCRLKSCLANHLQNTVMIGFVNKICGSMNIFFNKNASKVASTIMESFHACLFSFTKP